MLDKNCAQCGSQFQAKAERAKFCSRACAKLSSRRNIERQFETCQSCGRGLEGRKRGKFCSPQCYHKRIRDVVFLGDHVKVGLTKGQFALVDAEDYDRIRAINWYAKESAGTYYAKAAMRIGGRYKKVAMHRYILELEDGAADVDHINGNGLDNRRANLRVCAHQQNMLNVASRQHSTSKFKGVSWSEKAGKWVAQIRLIDASPAIDKPTSSVLRCGIRPTSRWEDFTNVPNS